MWESYHWLGWAVFFAGSSDFHHHLQLASHDSLNMSENMMKKKILNILPTWEGLNGFQKTLCPCALDESSLGIWILIIIHHWWIGQLPDLDPLP